MDRVRWVTFAAAILAAVGLALELTDVITFEDAVVILLTALVIAVISIRER